MPKCLALIFIHTCIVIIIIIVLGIFVIFDGVFVACTETFFVTYFATCMLTQFKSELMDYLEPVILILPY